MKQFWPASTRSSAVNTDIQQRRYWLSAIGYRLLEWPLALLLLVLLLGSLAAAQLPLRVTLDLGADKGATRADAFAHDFYPPETRNGAAFRWSHAQSSIVLPGIGRRPLVLELSVLSHRAQFSDPARPTQLTLTVNGRTQTIALRREAARYMLMVPAAWMQNGSLDLGIATPPWRAPGDNRPGLGVALEQVQVRGAGPTWGQLPYAPSLLSWLVALLACWLALRLVGFALGAALLVCLPLAVVPPLGFALDPARLALGSVPLVVGLGWALVLLAALCWALPPLFRRLRLPATPAGLRWLALLAAVSFALRYGGRVYPGSMHGDLELHWHRYARVISGEVYILAAHRGLPFPFPGALYTLAAPFTLLGVPPWAALEWGAALLEATTPLLLALLAARCWRNMWAGIVAGAAYTVMAGGYMTTWFAFETHIFAQWATLLLWAALLLCWPRVGEERAGLARGAWGAALTLLVAVQSWVYLGHTGFLLNTVTLAAVGVPLLVWGAWRAPYRRAALQVAGATLTGGLLVGVFYYSAFLPLILSQLGGVASVGLLEVTGRRPVPSGETLRALWEDGILTHYGFFPLPLALAGLTILFTGETQGRAASQGERAALAAQSSILSSRHLLQWLIVLTFLVSASQAVLPLVTRSTLTTRYLMFAAWAVALAAAPALLGLWRRGRAGRIVVLGMALFVAWGTVALWTGALLYNIAPPEPF